MNLSESLNRAPVTEAIFEIQVELPLEVTIENLDQLCGKIKSEYPTKRSRKRFEGKIELKKDGPPASQSIDLGVDGFLNWSVDEKQVVQFRLDGYSFSRLKPYSKWEKHFPEVFRLWTLFSKTVSPLRIKRIAIRFINVIEIPRESAMQDYLANYPKPPSDGFVLNNFFNRIELNIPDKNINAIITQALANSNDPINKSIILDIEVFKEINSQINENTITDVFQVLRDVKNDVFKKSLTDKAEGLFIWEKTGWKNIKSSSRHFCQTN